MKYKSSFLALFLFKKQITVAAGSVEYSRGCLEMCNSVMCMIIIYLHSVVCVFGTHSCFIWIHHAGRHVACGGRYDSRVTKGISDE